MCNLIYIVNMRTLLGLVTDFTYLFIYLLTYYLLTYLFTYLLTYLLTYVFTSASI